MKTEWRIVRITVHLPDIHTSITRLSQFFDPRPPPQIRILQHTRRMWIVTGKQTRPRRRTGSSRDETVRKGRPLIDEPIQIRRFHVGKPQRIDRIKPLLISNDKNNIRLVGHRCFSTGFVSCIDEAETKWISNHGSTLTQFTIQRTQSA